MTNASEVPTPINFNVQEAAAALRVSPRMVRKLIARRELPVVRIGRRVLVPRDGLADWNRSRMDSQR